VLLYYSREAPAKPGDILSLMKMRAIEHRAGVAVLAGDVREMVKTTKHKNIQRFQEKNGVFGLNRDSLGGTWSTATTFIPRRWFPHYLSLLEPCHG
jgi:hypothetical protein